MEAGVGADSNEPLAQDELELWSYVVTDHKLRSLDFLSVSTTGKRAHLD